MLATRRIALLAACLVLASHVEAQCMSPWLEDTEVVPPNSSGGQGLAFVQIDTGANTLSYDLTFIGLGFNETAAHIHGFAAPGSNAPILHTLPLGNNKTGTWVYPEALEGGLLSGEAYIDVHSLAHPAGHVRGQLIAETSDATLYGRLTVEQLIPPLVGPGQTAIVVVNLDLAADVATLKYKIYPVAGSFFSALNGYAPAGQSGEFLTSLSNGSETTWNYPPEDEGAILSGLMYAENYGGSEALCRGQVHLMRTAVAPATSYCTAGTSSTGCQAVMGAAGYPSASAPAGFTLQASGAPGLRNGIFFFGVNGKQANAWGNGTSFQCVTPPVSRAGLMVGEGTAGLCDGSFARDLNARWCPTCPFSAQNPGGGALVQAQLWYRDPLNTSNQSTSLSDAIEFLVQP